MTFPLQKYITTDTRTDQRTARKQNASDSRDNGDVWLKHFRRTSAAEEEVEEDHG